MRDEFRDIPLECIHAMSTLVDCMDCIHRHEIQRAYSVIARKNALIFLNGFLPKRLRLAESFRVGGKQPLHQAPIVGNVPIDVEIPRDRGVHDEPYAASSIASTGGLPLCWASARLSSGSCL